MNFLKKLSLFTLIGAGILLSASVQAKTKYAEGAAYTATKYVYVDKCVLISDVYYRENSVNSFTGYIACYDYDSPSAGIFRGTFRTVSRVQMREEMAERKAGKGTHKKNDVYTIGFKYFSSEKGDRDRQKLRKMNDEDFPNSDVTGYTDGLGNILGGAYLTTLKKLKSGDF